LMIIAIAAVVLLGGGGAAFMMTRGKEGAPKEEQTTAGEIASDAHGEGDSHGGGHGKKEEKGGHGESHGGGEGPAVAADETPETIYKFDHPFVVNLMESSGRWFVQVLLEIETTTPEGVGRAKKNVAPLRDTIIMLLSSKTKDEISTTEGKLRLKQEIIMRMDGILGPGTMKTVYFTDFSVHMS
jgi:flagellar FliL protein